MLALTQKQSPRPPPRSAAERARPAKAPVQPAALIDQRPAAARLTQLAALANASGPAPAGGTVQRVFRDTATGGAPVPNDEIVLLLQGRKKQLEQRTQLPLATLVKKLAEGPDIPFDKTNPTTLVERVDERLQGRAERDISSPSQTSRSSFRKLNRLAGQFEGNLRFVTAPEMVNDVAPLVKLLPLLSAKEASLEITDQILTTCSTVLTRFSLITDTRGWWQSYNLLGLFGPLGFWLLAEIPPTTKGKDRLAGLYEKNLQLLRIIRQNMARRESVSIVAHRGSGPTNRTMGGLIAQDDQRRLNRPAENSPEAFHSALGHATGPTTRPGLDGVECDVFLSHDFVPIVTHEGKVLEQLSQLRQQLTHGISKHTEIHSLDSSQLVALQRTGSAHSRFMTLAELLDQIRPAAYFYFLATGHPFRVEIEMKGTKVEKPQGKHSPPIHKPGSLQVAVGKTVSQAIKANRGLPVEYVLFNGEPDDVVGFSQLRQTKTALGGMYTALGKMDGSVDPRHVDELRYMFAAEIGKTPLHSPHALPVTQSLLQNFIVTLVYAQELVPHGLPMLQHQEPDKPLEGGIKSASELQTDLHERAQHRPTSDDRIHRLLEDHVKQGGPTDRLHILTDYPRKAAWLKDRLDPEMTKQRQSLLPPQVLVRIDNLPPSQMFFTEDLDQTFDNPKDPNRVHIVSGRFLAQGSLQSAVVVVANPPAAQALIHHWNDQALPTMKNAPKLHVYLA